MTRFDMYDADALDASMVANTFVLIERYNQVLKAFGDKGFEVVLEGAGQNEERGRGGAVGKSTRALNGRRST